MEAEAVSHWPRITQLVARVGIQQQILLYVFHDFS